MIDDRKLGCDVNPCSMEHWKRIYASEFVILFPFYASRIRTNGEYVHREGICRCIRCHPLSLAHTHTRIVPAGNQCYNHNYHSGASEIITFVESPSSLTIISFGRTATGTNSTRGHTPEETAARLTCASLNGEWIPASPGERCTCRTRWGTETPKTLAACSRRPQPGDAAAGAAADGAGLALLSHMLASKVQMAVSGHSVAR